MRKLWCVIRRLLELSNELHLQQHDSWPSLLSRKKTQMSCNKIHYFSLSLSLNVSYPTQPPSIRPSSPYVEPKGPCLSSSQEYHPHAPLHSSSHYHKLNPLTAPHKGEFQSVYPPAQWEIWTRPFNETYRHRLGDWEKGKQLAWFSLKLKKIPTSTH